MLAFFKKILFALFVAAAVLFAYQNLEPLSQSIQFQIDPYFRESFQTPKLPVVFLFVVAFLAGMLTAGFHGVYERMARRVEIRRRDKRIRELEKEVGEFRAQAAELKVPAAADEGMVSATLPPRREGTEPHKPQSLSPPPPVEEEPTL